MIGASKFISTRRVQVVGWALVATFLWLIAGFHDPHTGFTRLLSIGDQLEQRAVPELRHVPHYIHDGALGYDGAYYVQLALHPTLHDPALQTAIDNPPYRARRMLMFWSAWALGLGRDAWIVNVFALLNVGCWLALAWRLLRWFPLNTWDNLLRWAGLLFSAGVCMSVRNSLADLPGLLLVACAVAWLERGQRGRGIAGLAAAALTKETSVIAATALLEPKRDPNRPELRGARRWLRFAGAAVLVALPLALWALYVRARLGAVDGGALGNFNWPGFGLAEKWGTVVSELRLYGTHPPYLASLLAVVALTTQGVFLFARWQPENAWWRVGAASAVLMLFVAKPVWEGYPGAAPRVLLPMTLAFNVLVPRGRRWLPVLVLGNLTALVAVRDLVAPPEFFEVRGAAAAQVRVERGNGWYAAETIREHRWRWSAGEGTLTLTNESGRSLAIALHGSVTSAGDERRLRLSAGEAMIWSEEVTAKMSDLRCGFVLPPGELTLTFKSDQPPRLVDTDPRPMAFKVMNLEIVVSPANRQP